MADRTVHGVTNEGAQVVRYDRAGKWYVEPRDARRKHLTVAEAARLVAGGTHYDGLPGGGAFDRQVRLIKEVSGD